MEIYFGETIDDVKKEIKDGAENIFITSPSIYDNETDISTYMYPNEARLKNLTYKTCVFCNIGLISIISSTIITSGVSSA